MVCDEINLVYNMPFLFHINAYQDKDIEKIAAKC